MGKKINCNSTPRGRKSKDQGGKEIKGCATIYTPDDIQWELCIFYNFL